MNFKKAPTLFRRHPWYLNLSWGVLACLLLFLWQHGPSIQPDTASYLASSPIRSALYPMLLRLNTWLFGQGHFKFLVFVQIAYGIFGTVFLAQKIRKLFDLELWAAIPLIICLLNPYYGPGRFGNAILTEALCYPTFLLAFAYLLEGLIRKSSRCLLYFLALTAVLILTRRQFLFVYPVFGIVLVYYGFFERKALKVGFLTFAFIISIISTHLLEKTYQYSVHGNFSIVPFTGIQLVVAPLYLAKDSDIHLFNTSLERVVFKETKEQLRQRKLSFDSRNESSSDLTLYYAHFYESYGPICYGVLSPILAKNGINDVYQIDKITTNMAIKLIYKNWKACFILYLLNIIFNMGGYYYCLFLAIVGLFALIHYYKHRDALSLGCLLAFALSAANYSLITLVELILRRYSVYTDSIQISLLLVCIMVAFRAWSAQHQIKAFGQTSKTLQKEYQQ